MKNCHVSSGVEVCECVCVCVCECVSVCRRMRMDADDERHHERVRRPSYACGVVAGHFPHRRHYAVRRKLGRRSGRTGRPDATDDSTDTVIVGDVIDDVRCPMIKIEEHVGEVVGEEEEEGLEEEEEEEAEEEVQQLDGLDFLCLADASTLLHPTLATLDESIRSVLAS